MNIDLNGNTLVSGYFSGIGEDLTNLDASSITTGIVADERLSSNVSLLNATNDIPPTALMNGGTSPNSVTFYRGDGTWQAPGSITALTGFKNLIIGGDFSTNPWQRGTSFFAPNINYTADRWVCNFPQMTVSRQSDIGLPGFLNSLRMQRTPGSIEIGYLDIMSVLRSANAIPLQGKTVTISVWARCGADFSAASNGAAIQFKAGTGIDEGSLLAEENAWTGFSFIIPSPPGMYVTTSWTRYNVQAIIPSTVNELALQINWIPKDSTPAGANDWLELAGVQVEINPYVTAFEVRPAELELALCQAYYEVGGGGSVYENYCTGQCTAATAARGFIPFKVPKRVAPAITLNGAASLWAADNATGGQVAGTAISANYPTIRGFELDITTASSLVAGNATNIRANNSTAQGWVANAEL